MSLIRPDGHIAHLRRLFAVAAAQVVGGTNLPYAGADVIDLDLAAAIINVGAMYTAGVDAVTIQQAGVYRIALTLNIEDNGVGATIFAAHIGVAASAVETAQVSATLGFNIQLHLEHVAALAKDVVVDFRAGSDSAETGDVAGMCVTVQQLTP